MLDNEFSTTLPQGADTSGRTELNERYLLTEKIGSGGMGEVHLAHDSKLDRQVALKSIRSDQHSSDETLKRIRRECLLHAKIGAHPNIVTLYDLIEDGDQIHIIMEYVEGETLKDKMAARERAGAHFSIEESLLICIHCLRALSHTHKFGIIHRDVKPANVMVAAAAGAGFTAKILDFGIARAVTGDTKTTTLTRPGNQSPGTPLYMAPEQIDAETFGKVSPATDVYTTGVMLYHLLAGRPPFTGTLTDVFNGHLNFKPKPIQRRDGEALEPVLAAALEKALAKRPDDRYPTAEAFLEALETALALREARSASLRLPARGWVKWAGAGAVCLAVAFAGLAALRTPGSAEAPDAESLVAAPEERASEAAPDEQASKAAVEAGLRVPVPRPRAPVDAAAVDAPEEWETVMAPRDGPKPVVVQPASGERVAAGDAPSGLPAEAAEATAFEQEAPPGTEFRPPIPEETLADGTGEGEAASDAPAPETEAEAPPGAGAPPAPEEATLPETYTVQSGDTLAEIADQFEIDRIDLAKWNLIRNPNNIAVGQVLYLYERPDLPEIEVNWGAAPPKATAPPPEVEESDSPDKPLESMKDKLRQGWRKLRGKD